MRCPLSRPHCIAARRSLAALATGAYAYTMDSTDASIVPGTPGPPTHVEHRDLLRPLRRRAAVAWIGAVASVALLWAEHHLRVLHPLALLFIVLLVITSAAAIGSLVRGLWRLWRGPRRLAAVGWMSLAILPALLWPGLGWYGFYKWHRREISHQLPFTLAAMAGASLMEA